MTIEELTIESRIIDTQTGRKWTVTRMPTSRKKSIGIVEDGTTTEKMMWRSELGRYRSIA